MRLSQVRDFVNQIHNTQTRRAFEVLLDALEEAGLDVALEEKELAQSMLNAGTDEEITEVTTEVATDVTPEDEDEDLSENELKAEHDYVVKNLPDEDQDESPDEPSEDEVPVEEEDDEDRKTEGIAE